VDIAPECDEDFRFIKKISQKCVVSAAHTTADYDTAIESFDAGIRHATHLFNAMTGFNHRAPGMVGAVFEDDRITAELICDGFHIHPSVIQTVFKLIPDRIAVISDSISLNGMPEGTEALLGEQKIFSNGKTAVMDDGTIAGSITNLYAEFKNLLLWGIPFETAVKSLTLIPAESVGIADKTGSIKKGKKADLIVLRRSLEIAAVYHS
jgi:N-acetylglucosamine-6-phosphate deacetylase